MSLGNKAFKRDVTSIALPLTIPTTTDGLFMTFLSVC